ncbi:MAG: helix-turn-helix domain-containing protein [Anaeromyxobacteraceae bacterium]
MWTAADVASFLRVSRSWVYLHAEAGDLPSVKIGGLRRFLPDQIRAYAGGEAAPRTTIVAISPRGR